MNKQNVELSGSLVRPPSALLWGIEGPQGGYLQPAGVARLRAVIAHADVDAALQLTRYLGGAGFDVYPVHSSRDLFGVIEELSPDLVVLHLDMPDEHGLQTCWRVRGCSGAALILVTADDQRLTGVIGIETGADDCLVMPVSPRELLARARAILRRRSCRLVEAHDSSADRAVCYRFASLTLSTARRQLLDAVHGVIPLTAGEYRILCALLAARGKVLPKAQLARDPNVATAVRAHNVASTMYHLRQKLSDAGASGSIIGTVRSVGYVIKVRIDVTVE